MKDKPVFLQGKRTEEKDGYDFLQDEDTREKDGYDFLQGEREQKKKMDMIYCKVREIKGKRWI